MRRYSVLLIALGLALAGCAQLARPPTPEVALTGASTPVAPVLNEYVANHTGTDSHEYLEVFGDPETDYSAYAILQIEGDAGATGVIDSVHPVGTTNATGHWTSGFLTNVLENGTVTFLLVKDFSGAVGLDLDTNDDGTLDVAPWSEIADGVAVSDGGTSDRTYTDEVLAAGLGGSPFTPGGASRVPDGGLPWVLNDFDGEGLPGFVGTPAPGEALNTPGAPNAAVSTLPAECSAAFTPAYDIQGSGMAAAITGTVTTQGVVVGDYEGPSPTLRGFYLQDPVGDGDPTTSDGIFVFHGNNDAVNLGDLVRVTGTAGEFQDQTQISATGVLACGTGSVDPVDVTLPIPSATYLERYEGMLVRLPQTLTVTEHFQLGRFGMVVLSAEGRLAQPTQVVAPGADALALQAANDLNRLILDDALNNQNPDPILFGRGGLPLSASNTLRGGDTVTSVIGVMTYTWAGNAASGNAYRVRPVNALGGGVPDFQPSNTRPAAPESVGGTLRVGVLNLLNYFDTFTGCTAGVGGEPTQCRGAENPNEFDRQWPKTVSAIVGMDVDVLAILEIENDGYGPTSAIADLVGRLNDATSPGAWAFIDADAATGRVNALGTDAIKVGLLYRPAAVTPVGTTAALDTPDFVNGGDAAARNRPALAQAFASTANAGTFIAVANHLKSKGSVCDDPDAGDGQGNCNLVRTRAAQEQLAWLATDPTGTGDPDVLILGDLNAYAKEDPVAAFEDVGFTNLQALFQGDAAYTYVFDGQWGSLDHALASPSLLGQVTGAASWAINADEPGVLDYNTNFKSAGQVASLYAPDAFRSSDHDPLVIGLALEGLAPPSCVLAAPSVGVLWPPDLRFVPVTIEGVTGDRPVAITITSVFQDEPVSAPAAVNALRAPDAIGVGSPVAQLRAERDGRGNGRVYHVGFRATDSAGLTCDGTVLVSVPRDLGKKNVTVDGGPLYDATVP